MSQKPKRIVIPYIRSYTPKSATHDADVAIALRRPSDTSWADHFPTSPPNAQPPHPYPHLLPGESKDDFMSGIRGVVRAKERRRLGLPQPEGISEEEVDRMMEGENQNRVENGLEPYNSPLPEWNQRSAEYEQHVQNKLLTNGEPQ